MNDTVDVNPPYIVPSLYFTQPGLLDRVFVLHAGSRGFDSHWGTCPNDFSDPIDQNICDQ